MNDKKSTRSHRPFLAILLVLGLSACGSTGVPRGITPVSDFELDRYLGTWYEIARLDHKFERGLKAVTATYSLNDDGSVKVVNSGINIETGKSETATGKAKFVGATNQGHLKVSFFGPFYGSYVIYDLDQDAYQHALVAGPDRSYMWLLSRTPVISDSRYQALLDIASDNGYDTSQLIQVDHQ